MILANRLVLNLRTRDKPNSSTPSTKTDIFFRNAYGGAQNPGDQPSFMGSVLGNIGAPLRVGDEDDDVYIAEGDEGTQGMELVFTRTSVYAAHKEPGPPAQLEDRTDELEGTERTIDVEDIARGDEVVIQARTGGELQV